MATASPTSRSLKLLREEGGIAAVVEFWNRFAVRPNGGRGIRQDLFGFADIFACFPGDPEVRLVQTTSYSCVSARKKKILASPLALICLRSGATIIIHGWAKRPKSKDDKRLVWKCRVVEITESDFPQETVAEADAY
jgi:hypothetical protein